MQVHLTFTASPFSLGAFVGEGYLLRRVNLPISGVFLNPFEYLMKAIVHLLYRIKKVTEVMTLSTNWPFAVFATGQENGLRIIEAFLFFKQWLIKYWKRNGL